MQNVDLLADIESHFEYIPSEVTFSVKLDEKLSGKRLKFPKTYKHGYNELGVLGKTNAVIRKIPFYLDVRVLVPVVANKLGSGVILSENAVMQIWKDFRDLNDNVIFDKKSLYGKQNKFYKSKGDVFNKYDLKEKDVIFKQDDCVIEAKSGSVTVFMPGVSLKNGAVGSTIKVLNKQTGKRLSVRVLSSKNVEVIVN